MKIKVLFRGSRGLGQMLEIWPTENYVTRVRDTQRATNGLRQDWKVVGDSISRAVTEFGMENKLVEPAELEIRRNRI